MDILHREDHVLGVGTRAVYADHDQVLASFLVTGVACHTGPAGDEDASGDALTNERLLGPRPDGVHDAGGLTAQDVREGYLLRERVVARSGHRVAGERDQDGPDTDPYLAFARLGERDILHDQHLRPSEGPHHDRLHQ